VLTDKAVAQGMVMAAASVAQGQVGLADRVARALLELMRPEPTAGVILHGPITGSAAD
jgi:hypothetical protein